MAKLDLLRSDGDSRTTEMGRLEGLLIRSDQLITKYEQAIDSLPPAQKDSP